MKKIYLFLALGLMLLLVSLHLEAQPNKKQSAPPNGYWVIENNIKTPKNSTVYFYNQNNELIHQQNVQGKRLKVHRNKIVRQLNAALAEALIAWQNKRAVKDLVKDKR